MEDEHLGHRPDGVREPDPVRQHPAVLVPDQVADQDGLTDAGLACLPAVNRGDKPVQPEGRPAPYLFTEFLFNYQGLGLLFYDILGKADYPVLLAYTLIGAVFVVVGNLIADIALTVADPRIRLA
ncbi:MAG: ABC transporter permease subunit [Streptosporangiaceae bacterium]